MVKLTPVGKKRPFLRGLTLTILTMGLYGIYWVYKAPHEVYTQFELDEERRDEGVIWLVVGLVVPILVFVYLWKSAENVRYVRRRFGLENGIGPGAFVALHVVGPLVAVVLGGVLAVVSADPAVVGLDDVAPSTVAAIALGIVAVSFALLACAYFFLQRSINEVWDAWAARARALRVPRPAPAPA